MKDCLAKIIAPRPGELTLGELKLLQELKLVRVTRTTAAGVEYELTHAGSVLAQGEMS